MAANPAAYYGRDIACMDDADALFSDVTGLGVVLQDAYHRLTNDSVLGSIDGEEPNEETDNWGFDVQRLAGMRSDEIDGLPPIISAALQKDPRILTADVVIQRERVSVKGRFYDLTLAFRCFTALGPFEGVLGINSVSVALLGGSLR